MQGQRREAGPSGHLLLSAEITRSAQRAARMPHSPKDAPRAGSPAVPTRNLPLGAFRPSSPQPLTARVPMASPSLRCSNLSGPCHQRPPSLPAVPGCSAPDEGAADRSLAPFTAFHAHHPPPLCALESEMRSFHCLTLRRSTCTLRVHACVRAPACTRTQPWPSRSPRRA